MYKQDGFKPYDERTTAQGARQQEGKSPNKFTEEENTLKTSTEGSNINNDAGFNPASSTVAQATKASKASEASTKVPSIVASQASARMMKPPTTITPPQARVSGSGNRGKMTEKMAKRLQMSGKEGSSWWSKWNKAKQDNIALADKKFQIKGQGDSVMNTKLQSINSAMGVNLHKSA